jgi:hypothetical protein
VYDAQHKVRLRLLRMNAKHLCDQNWRNLLAIDFTA